MPLTIAVCVSFDPREFDKVKGCMWNVKFWYAFEPSVIVQELLTMAV